MMKPMMMIDRNWKPGSRAGFKV